jgi:hypothetical protein
VRRFFSAHPCRGTIAILRRRGGYSTSRATIAEEDQEENQTEGEKKDLEGPPRTASSKAGLAPFEARPKTKTGNLAVPRFSAFLFAVVAS